VSIRAIRGLFSLRSLMLVAALGACDASPGDDEQITLRFWAMGAEGERVQQLIPEFERQNPGVRVRVQGIPWTAAHEKILTAHVGDASPDVSQLGNTWVPELQMLGALEPLDSLVAASSVVTQSDFFPGIWATNVIDGVAYGIPWYVDTRVLYYRTDLLARAGYDRPPETWEAWVEAMRKVKALGPPVEHPILLPLDEWAQPVIFGLQTGSPLLKDGGRYGAFSDSAFRRAFEFYVGLFRQGLAPPLANTQIANVFQEFAAGRIAMYITGPWNIGEFRRRLPPDVQDKWATAPLPGPDGSENGFSTAGGASLVVYKSSEHKALAWKLVEFLAATETQVRFYELTGDLPARISSWGTPALAGDDKARAFYEQLQRVRPAPQVPEWEQIAQRVAQAGEQAGRGRRSVDEALAALDRDVNQMLEKRRWMLARQGARAQTARAGR
jgi:multiple sugar transport system substrate-binding protein